MTNPSKDLEKQDKPSKDLERVHEDLPALHINRTPIAERSKNKNKKTKLTDSQELYCLNMAQRPDLSLTAIYIASFGYCGEIDNPKTACKSACRLNNNPIIIERINSIRENITYKCSMGENELLNFYAAIVRDPTQKIADRMKAGQHIADISPNIKKNDEQGTNVTINNITDQERVQIVFGDERLLDEPNTLNVIPENLDDIEEITLDDLDLEDI